eukprot:9158323-Pyramimonas_sp.AAC.1
MYWRAWVTPVHVKCSPWKARWTHETSYGATADADLHNISRNHALHVEATHDQGEEKRELARDPMK